MLASKVRANLEATPMSKLIRKVFFVYETPTEYETVRLIQRLLEEKKRRPKHIYAAQLSRMRVWDREHKGKPRFVPNKDAAELRQCHVIVGPDEREGVEAQVRGLHCLARDAELKPHWVGYGEALRELGWDAESAKKKEEEEEEKDAKILQEEEGGMKGEGEDVSEGVVREN